MHSLSKSSIALALGSCLGSFVTAAVCLGPLAGILLGVGGLGWLTQYASLRTPATVATFVLLALGYRKVQRIACAPGRRRARVVLLTASALAIVVNAVEYFVLPNLI
jgi:hypothetical protein